MDKTMNELLPQLRPVQQEFICECVREYTDRTDMHRGLLPFLPVIVASQCVRIKSIRMQMPENKFIRQILSALGPVHKKLVHDEEAVVMQLSTKKLWRFFRTRKDYVHFDARSYNLSKGTISVQLERANYNQWRVRTSKRYQQAVTIWLADNFR